jgi:type I restriction enzyme M protein
MFLHGIEEFQIVRGDTLAQPAFLEHDALKKFNIILANPPYSIKAWDRKSFENDPWGRNLWGTPPQGCADYAFQQHIHKSMHPINGRYAILWPHGILFRDMEATIRKKMVETDEIEAVIGLGPNLFYNSPMEAMILIGNSNKAADRKGKVLFVNGKDLVIENKGQAHLSEQHIKELHQAYLDYEDKPFFAKVATLQEILELDGNMNINFYVKKNNGNNNLSFVEAYTNWKNEGEKLKNSMANLFEVLK